MADDTKFYIEVPNEYGWTSKPFAVVEARLVIRDSLEVLIPVAPALFVKRWPNGWNRRRGSSFSWVETEGPARLLKSKIHESIVLSIIMAGAKKSGPESALSTNP